MKRFGKVFLAGAGPGDPDLATLGLIKALERCDVVVYDFLANPVLLNYAPQAEKICVGKRAGAHSHSQEEINTLILDLAREGKMVLRLKGGDPFVFGRGGEEALVLRGAGIAFEVLPGISSGIAALAYAGIPLTQRGMASSAVLATGQEESGKPLSPSTIKNLAKLAQGKATLVFYMATAQAQRICSGLIRAGLKSQTPAALIHQGTLPGQKVLSGDLKSLPALMKKSGLGAPGLIVVGSVVGLGKQLSWLEQRPFFGRRIAVTRAREQASRLAASLREGGAEVLETPSIRIKPLPLPQAKLKAILNCRWLILSSTNGVARLFEELEACGWDARALKGLRVAAIGESTAQALRGHGVIADFVPETFVAESLAEGLLRLEGSKLRGASVVFARAKEGRDVLPAALKKAGAKVLDLALYKTVPEASQAAALSKAIVEGRLDWVTFSSSSTVKFFEQQLSPQARKLAKKMLLAFCMGPITRAEAEKAGYQVALESPRATIGDFVRAMEAYAGPSKP
jgi:uroporphyrinogen III methyltransferase/synthase